MEKALRLLMLLSGNRKYTRKEISERFDVAERTVYRYLSEIENSGFVLDKTSEGYQLLKSDYNTKSLKKLLHFSEDEAYILYRALLELGEYRHHAKNIIKKLHSLYDFQALQKLKSTDDLSKIKSISTAIEKQKQIVLRQYHSSNSHKVEDRNVEPFELMSDYKAIWCYDLKDQKVKQFKISRTQEVDVLTAAWKYSDYHKLPFTDAFRMSALEPILQVEATLSLKAYNLLKEEFPAATPFVKQHEKEYQLNIPIADYHGIGRFVLGLLDEIKVCSPQQFKDFLNEKIKIKF